MMGQSLGLFLSTLPVLHHALFGWSAGHARIVWHYALWYGIVAIGATYLGQTACEELWMGSDGFRAGMFPVSGATFAPLLCGNFWHWVSRVLLVARFALGRTLAGVHPQTQALLVHYAPWKHWDSPCAKLVIYTGMADRVLTERPPDNYSMVCS